MKATPIQTTYRRMSGLGLIGVFSLSACALYLCAPPSLAAPAAAVSPAPAANRPSHKQYAVSTESPAATRDAVQILAQGGTAADAAVVAALVAGVTAPTSSGIGGGGFLLAWEQTAGKPYSLDFRETAPSGLVAEPFENQPLPPEQAGHLIGVPGEIKGLFALHQRAGKTPWAELVMRASKHATDGYFVGEHLAAMLKRSHTKLIAVPGLGSLFYPQGKPALVGMRLKHPALGQTLARIAHEGPEVLYQGAIAQDIVETARKYGSPMTLDDLAKYEIKERTPLATDFEGATVYTMPAPSAGGLMLSEVLRLYSADELRHLGHGSPAYQHLLAEAMRGAISDRMRYMGDPDIEKVDISALLDQERLDKRRAKISLERTHALPRFGLEEHGTHALITSDRDGNVVSLTTTVNRLFGAKVYAERSGIVLNDELNDFTVQADVVPFGLEKSPNRPRPGARPVSSMTPTLVVEDGQVKLALGGSGGMTIPTNATQVLLSAWVFDHSAQRAVSAPRIYIPTSKESLLIDPGAKADHIISLEERGEVVKTMPFLTTAVQLIKIKDGQVEAAADPRKHGLARTGR